MINVERRFCHINGRSFTMDHDGQKTVTRQNASKKCLKFLSEGKKSSMRIKLFQKLNNCVNIWMHFCYENFVNVSF